MFHLNKQKIIFALLICLFLSATKVAFCRCVIPPNENISDAVKSDVSQSTMVFTGKVVGFEYRKGIPNQYIEQLEKDSGKHIDYETMVVKLQVELWWKGEPTTEVFLATMETKSPDGTGTNMSEDFHFKEGESYLVYAYGEGNQLRTHACTRTRLLTETEDLTVLGEGKKPVEKIKRTEQIIERRDETQTFIKLK